MTKYYGAIGFGITAETTPGVWVDQIFTRKYFGDVTRNTRSLDRGDQVNDDINISNTFSIVADAFAFQNFTNMKYIEWLGQKWKVSTVDVQRPRLILSVNGLYNGPVAPVGGDVNNA